MKPAPGARARILIIEDTPLNMELTADILETAGYAVLQAATAEAGLVVARAERPDLILLDIRLPGMDGHGAVRELKTDPATRRIPVLALTAQAMKGDDESARASGFDGYIAKPIDTRTFVDTVAAFLNGDSA